MKSLLPGNGTAESVRAEIARAGIKRSDVASHLGLSQSAFSRRLNGEVDFRTSEVVAIAKKLRVPVDSLIAEERAS